MLEIINKTLQIQKPTPTIVGISGVDASGKTTYATKLVKKLKKHTDRQIIYASIDGFHNLQEIRYKQGKDSPKGYYKDSFNHDAIKSLLLDPLSNGDLNYKTAIFDWRSNKKVEMPFEKAKKNAILIFEGIFLFRPEFVDYFDLKIWLDINFDTMVERAVNRDPERKGLRESCKKKYIPGQKIYIKKAKPKLKADIIINNS
jgi:uridine kinase